MITLRRYPYPYQAAFTVCSDIDSSSWQDFTEIHAFLNTDAQTPFGPGVNLEIGDSFWFYSDQTAGDHAFSYFGDHPGEESIYAPVLRELIRSGWLDTLHSYGNFGPALPFRRQLAELAVAESRVHNLEFPVWVNHGDLGRNPQSFGEGHGTADDPGNEEIYHTDLLPELGVSFFWESESYVNPVIGQDRPVPPWEAYFQPLTMHGLTDRAKHLYKVLNDYRNRWRRKRGKTQLKLWLKDPAENRLYEKHQLCDGQHMYRFCRFGHGRYDWSEDIPQFLNEQTLHRLISREGTSILYVHIGDRRNRNQPALDPGTVKSFQLLASRAHQSREVLVSTTARLLGYHALRDNLRFSTETEGDLTVIRLMGVTDPLIQNRFQQKEALRGLTFYTDEPESTIIKWKGEIIDTMTNPQDSSGRPSISIPWKSLPPFPIESLRKISKSL
mgnify:CR=1 FL=1